MASVNLEEKANFTRLSRLLVDKGTEALRNTLNAFHPSANLPAVLNAKKTSLLKSKHRVINDTQWDLLFPPSGNPPDSKTFDITLLTVLLRNICGVTPPATGWKMMPPDIDRSLQANILRIKYFRNEVFAHVASAQVDKTAFENLWQKISQALVDLNIQQNDIDDLKICPLSGEEEIYVQSLKEWFLKETDSKDMLIDTQQSNLQLKNMVQHLMQITEGSSSLKRSENEDVRLQQLAKHNFKSKVRSKLEFFHPGTRNWLLEMVENWFTKEDESRLLLITARPGSGKSVFAAKACDLFGGKGKFAACHFCDFSDSNLKDPKMMLQSLASHMCENVPGFKEKLLDQLNRPHKVNSLKDAFQIYLQNPLDELEVEPRLIVIDGLDESATDDKSAMVNLIADYFPDLPKCVKVLLTSRPQLSLQTLQRIQMIDVDAKIEENRSDLLEYLKVYLPNLAARDALNVSTQAHYFCRFSFLRAIVQMCEGSFLYAFHVQHELCKRDDLDTIHFREILFFLPKGMGCVYKDYFRRLEMELEEVMKNKPDLFKLFELLVATNKSLPLKFVARAFGLDLDCRETKRIINKVNEALSCVLYVSNDMVTVFHKSVYDWLLANGDDDHEYTVKVSDGKRRLWLLCEQIFEETKSTVTSGLHLKLTNEVKHALEYGHMYLLACNMKESFHWLVDMIIVYVVLTYHPQKADYLYFLWGDVLRSREAISLQLRQRISWHLYEIYSMHFELMDPSFVYLQLVLEHSPKGHFTDDERKIADVILGTFSQNVKRHSVERKSLKLHLAKLFSSPITAIGVSSNKKLAAVALKDGTISVLSLPELIELFQFPTGYERISCCIFSPEDSFVLYGKLGTVLSIANKKEVAYFNDKVEKFKSCSFSPNGKRLVTNNGSNTVKLWDVGRQSLVSVLCADIPLNRCSFSKTGLFIIGDTEDSYCVWSAITFHRVDLRSSSSNTVREKDGFRRSETCNRCIGQCHKELIRWEGLGNSTGMYNDVDCILHLDQQHLHFIESIHLTTLASWGLFLQYDRNCTDITAIEDDLWLYTDKDKLIVFISEPPQENQLCLSSLTTVLWCCFSPDGSQLATCTSDGFINLWNVGTTQVYQRFRSNIGSSSAACWLSEKYLFVCHFNEDIPSLSLYPVDENGMIIIHKMLSMPLCPVVKEFLPFSGILDFSEGYISFERSKTKPVKVVDVMVPQNCQLARNQSDDEYCSFEWCFLCLRCRLQMFLSLEKK